MLLIAVAIWGTGVALAVSLYGLQALMEGADRLHSQMRRNRRRLALSRAHIKRDHLRPLGSQLVATSLRQPNRNGHRRRASPMRYMKSLDPRRGLR